jgi:hypothetical protein
VSRLLVAALALVAPVAAAAGLNAAPPLLSIVLRPAQVGSGYRIALIPGGDRVRGQVSLDLCGQSFASEKLRVARLQVAYAHRGKVPQLSNEVVRYRRGGAGQAMNELRHVATHCPKRPVTGPLKGVGPLRYRLTRVSDRRLLKPYVAVVMHATGLISGKHVKIAAFLAYQIRGEVLSAVYTDGTGAIAAQQHIGLRAAAASAKRLTALIS